MFRSGLIIFSLMVYKLHVTNASDCDCSCRGRSNRPICDAMEELWKISDSNTRKLMEWERYRPFVERFSERWKIEIEDIVEMKINELMSNRNYLPKPENLVSELNDIIEDDAIIISKPSTNENDLVSNLLVKVEMVENRTIDVEEELKSERRVRRHLEQEVKETQYSLSSLGNQLRNATFPVDSVMDQVQFVIHTSLDDMNKTIFEDHLKKLYYKVDGVVYKNETKELLERLEHMETEFYERENYTIILKLAENLKALEENLYILKNSVGNNIVPRINVLSDSIGSVVVPRIETLENETVRKEEVVELEHKILNLLNDTETFRNDLVDVISSIEGIKNFEKTFQNFSVDWSKSVELLRNQIEYLKNETVTNRPTELPVDIEDNNGIFQVKIVNKTRKQKFPSAEFVEYWDPEITDSMESVDLDPGIAPFIVDRKRIVENIDDASITDSVEHVDFEQAVTSDIVDRTRIGDPDINSCDRPVIKDRNLLVDVVKDIFGNNKLKFGCRPIGLSMVSHLPIPPSCEMGVWNEPFPSCKMLSNVSEIEDLATMLLEEHPCSTGAGLFPDPFNCSQHFMCYNEKSLLLPCPKGLVFDTQMKTCDFARTTKCETIKSRYEKELQTLIPPIQIEPDSIDKPGGHLGTGPSGQLIVHPRSSFTLHCLYPDNSWGRPVWNVTYTQERVSSRDLIYSTGKNKKSLTISAAEEGDSGIYKCLTPFGVQHVFEVEVKAVICPAFVLMDEYEDAFYRSTPEGELRIMGTTAEFVCQEGHRVTAQCLADGQWSRGLPLDEECTLKRRSRQNMWDCKPLELTKQPHLIAERNDLEKIITFKCAGGKRLIGNSFTRCRDDGVWSHVSLPRCIN